MTSLLTDAGRRRWHPSRFVPFTIGTPCGVKGANVGTCVGVCTANLVHGNSVVKVLRWVPSNEQTHLPKEKRHCTAGVACENPRRNGTCRQEVSTEHIQSPRVDEAGARALVG